MKKFKGFTLLELLVVIALSSIILLAIFEGYFTVKKLITHYHQSIRLQNNIRSVTYQIYQLAHQAGRLGCAHANQPFYLHLFKTKLESLQQLLYIKNRKVQGLAFFQPTDSKLKTLLPTSIYNRLIKNSAVIYTMQSVARTKKSPKEGYAVYSDCQDVFILPIGEACTDCFEDSSAIRFAGNLEIDLYFVASNKRKNHQDVPIYSLYKYNTYLGLQEVLEGVEQIDLSSNSNKIKVLLSSVEGQETIKQWLTIPV